MAGTMMFVRALGKFYACLSGTVSLRSIRRSRALRQASLRGGISPSTGFPRPIFFSRAITCSVDRFGARLSLEAGPFCDCPNASRYSSVSLASQALMARLIIKAPATSVVNMARDLHRNAVDLRAWRSTDLVVIHCPVAQNVMHGGEPEGSGPCRLLNVLKQNGGF